MIISAACYGYINGDWAIIPCHRHSDFFEIMKVLKCSYDKTTIQQGFIDYKDSSKMKRFVSREDAAKIAFECGQIKELKDTLFSEDLYQYEISNDIN